MISSVQKKVTVQLNVISNLNKIIKLFQKIFTAAAFSIFYYKKGLPTWFPIDKESFCIYFSSQIFSSSFVASSSTAIPATAAHDPASSKNI